MKFKGNYHVIKPGTFVRNIIVINGNGVLLGLSYDTIPVSGDNYTLNVNKAYTEETLLSVEGRTASTQIFIDFKKLN